MSISTKPPSGTRDFLPVEVMRRRHVVGIVQRVYELYGFVPLETPAFESLRHLLGKYGDEGDQLLYRLLHRRDALARALDQDKVSEQDLADLGLRYDLTVPLARVVAQYRDLPRYFKRYQIQPVWRADRPGRGRFREFYQCDVDIVGTESLLAEADVCAAVAQVLVELGFNDFTLRLNHRELLRGLIESAGIDPTMESTALVAVDKLDKIGRDGVLAELDERGIERPCAQRLLDLLVPAEPDADANATATHLLAQLRTEGGQNAVHELQELQRLLAATPAAGHTALCPELARGLSYYTGPIFEIAVADLPGSLGGGGRYDNLIGMFGKQQLPAVGCSLGLERILLVMQERGMYPPLGTGADVLVCWVDVAAGDALAAAHVLRHAGIRTELHPAGGKLGKQLQYANSPGVDAKVAAILGGDEQRDGSLTLKNLVTGQQLRAPLAQAAEQVSAWLGARPEMPS